MESCKGSVPEPTLLVDASVGRGSAIFLLEDGAVERIITIGDTLSECIADPNETGAASIAAAVRESL